MSKEVKIKLIKDQILVKPDEAEEKTATGLYIPATAAKPKNTGTVLVVGEECTSTIKKGDRIIYREAYGEELNYQDNEYIVLKEVNVFGII